MDRLSLAREDKDRAASWTSGIYRQLKPVASEKLSITDKANPSLRVFQALTHSWPLVKEPTYDFIVPFWQGAEAHPVWYRQKINQSAPLVVLPKLRGPLLLNQKKKKRPRKRRYESKPSIKSRKVVPGTKTAKSKPAPSADPQRNIRRIERHLDVTVPEQRLALLQFLRFERADNWNITNRGKWQGCDNVKWIDGLTAIGIYYLKIAWTALSGNRSQITISYRTFTLNSDRFIHFGPASKRTSAALLTRVANSVDSSYGSSIVWIARFKHNLDIDGRIPNSFHCLRDGDRWDRYNNRHYQPGVYQERQFTIGETFGFTRRDVQLRVSTSTKSARRGSFLHDSLRQRNRQPEEAGAILGPTATAEQPQPNSDVSGASTIASGESQEAYAYEDE